MFQCWELRYAAHLNSPSSKIEGGCFSGCLTYKNLLDACCIQFNTLKNIFKGYWTDSEGARVLRPKSIIALTSTRPVAKSRVSCAVSTRYRIRLSDAEQHFLNDKAPDILTCKDAAVSSQGAGDLAPGRNPHGHSRPVAWQHQGEG